MGCITAYPAPGSRSNFPRLALPIFLNDAFEAGGGERASELPSVSGTHSVWRIWSARPSFTEPERRLWKEREGRKGYIFTRAAFPKFEWKRWLLQFQFRPLDVEKGGGAGRVRREGGSSGGGSIDRPSPVAVAVHCHIIREERERARFVRSIF